MQIGLPHPRVLLVVALCVVSARGAPCQQKSAERAYVDAAIDGLVKAGVLTPEQAQQIKEDAAKAAAEAAAEAPSAAKPSKPKWYDTMRISGYTQARFQHYPDASEDGADNEFIVRRARIKLDAEPTDRTLVEFQLDTGEGEVTIKDAWVQYALTEDESFRLRAGLQKVPFGFEGPQSSSLRAPLERNWVAGWMFPGVRDTGLVAFWTDPKDAELFEQARKNDFGTGDFGNVAVGVYNGQGAAQEEANDAKHISIRLAKPFMIDGERYCEVGASYFTGRYYSSAAARDFDDSLFGAHLYLPPNPVGFQAEYFTGRTEGDNLDGFYAMGLWRPIPQGLVFTRYDQYKGSRKGKGLGNIADRERWTFGYAHLINDKLEATIEYDRDRLYGGESDDLLGIQLQLSY